MHTTKLRKEKIHGLLLGVAIADALGFPRENLTRRQALRFYGPRAKYSLLPGRGIYSDDTQLMFLAAQALLLSRNDKSAFTKAFQRRLRWYLLSLPIGIGKATIKASLRCWGRRFGVESGVNSAGNGAATRAILGALAIYKNGHRLPKWVTDTTRITHTHPDAIDGCLVLATLAEIAATTDTAKLEPLAVLDALVSASNESAISSKLAELKPFLTEGKSPWAVAKHFDWKEGISGYIVPTTIMAVYCWLRYPRDFERAVNSAIRLGGDTDSVAAIVGGLVGAHVGIDELPPNLVRSLGGFPHDPDWIALLADRVAQWPHGEHDLIGARGIPSYPLWQLGRNFGVAILVMAHVLCLRLPAKIFSVSGVKTKS